MDSQEAALRPCFRGNTFGASGKKKKPASSDSADNYVYFDWYDSTTYGPALKNVDQVYLVVPVMDMHPEDVMIPFIIDGRKERRSNDGDGT
ncbi:hypothetical protein [Paenibacillus sp. BIC5C1]|uniref:hypothetical protein n=1 Tax=Paenibacillus sp. BIC5C1 TaxID=3078263 RepID=UPI0028E7CDEB|nr:hypothetical protein [Paenibacillus sp. BIC5C1]